MSTPQKNHDLRLPDWGPYTKKYTGTSHIPDIRRGLRFDLAVLPGHYRRSVMVPNEKWESGHYAWEAAADLSFYSFRYELEWKDQVYADVSFSALSETAQLVRCAFVNNTAMPQNLMLHFMALMNFPPVRPYSDEPVQPARVHLPEGAVWIEALDYDDLRFANPRPQDTLVYDAMLRGEIRAHGFVNGSGIGQGFGGDAGDMVEYTIRLAQAVPGAALLLRYRIEQNATASFHAEGITNQSLTLRGGDGFSTTLLPLGMLETGEHRLRLTAQGGAPVELDGFAVLPEIQGGAVSFSLHQWAHAPEMHPGPNPQSLVLKYADAEPHYGIAWSCSDFVLREFYTAELDRYFRHMVHEHVQRTLVGPGEGHFTNIFMRPIPVAPHETVVIYGLACSGERLDVERELAGFDFEPAAMESIYQSARAKAVRMEGAPSGEPYRFSQERMAATTLLNVVYPVYTRRTHIRHSTPGKWWDCLYTWDSGFIGLGLLEIDLERAIDNLDAYLTDPDDPQAAFVHHGSFVPVQFYLFHELWNRTQDRTLLEYFYPRLRQYYLFLAGRSGSSTTRVLKSNLLKTWDYFYNSGGWDDYPPQVHVRLNGLQKTVSPAVTSAHAIRCAKILRAAAEELGASADLPLYDEDIAAFTDALQTHAWDGESGYFSYVVHDEAGMPSAFLRHESGANFDMGLDGAAPLYAGICTPEQERLLMERLFSPKRMWTPIGISTVDQSAPYYRKDGYWNGAVWFPHQWFVWKSMFDLSHPEHARKIAGTALDLWKQEVEASYYCFEHFIVESGRGAGWHQFSGLSTPVLSWYSAYHRPGRLTTGMDTWVRHHDFTGGFRRLEADLWFAGAAGTTSVLAAMQPGLRYAATWNGAPAPYEETLPGVLEIALNGREGRLVVSPALE